MPKMSILTASAREDDAIVGLPGTHIFGPCLHSLKDQTFEEFELVIVDSLLEERDPCFEEEWPFPIRYVEPKKSVWRDMGAWALCNSLNTGLIHAQGELIVRLDDCIRLRDEKHLGRIWDWYKDGRWVLGLFKRIIPPEHYHEKVAVKREDQDKLDKEKQYTEDGYRIKGLDTRWPKVLEAGGLLTDVPDNWMYGHSCVPLDALLQVNGWDENFDASKGLEDVDLGERLVMAGHGDRFIMDEEIYVESFEHKAVSKKVVHYAGLKPKVNGALMRANQHFYRSVANHPLTMGQVEWVRRDCMESNDYKEHPDRYDMGEGFDFWASHQPDYDLKELRERLGST